MTTAQEDKIIEQARQILERRQDEAARMFAIEHEIKINVQRLAMYASYYQGARVAVKMITDRLVAQKPKGEDWIYLKAEYDCITSSKRNMQLYLDGTEMRYRNHQRDKKGRLVSCEAYFVEYRQIIREIK